MLIRAWAFIQGFNPKEVFDQIFDTEKRAKWETVTMNLSVVENINELSQVIYFYVKVIGIFNISPNKFHRLQLVSVKEILFRLEITNWIILKKITL